MFSVVRVDLFLDWAKSHIGNLFDTIPYLMNFLLRDVILEVPERKLVCVFKLTVVLRMLLDCVVGQMDEIVVYVVGWVGLSWSSDVSFFEEVHIHRLCQKRPDSNVKFPFLQQHRLLDVLLYHKRTVIELEFLLLDHQFRLICKICWVLHFGLLNMIYLFWHTHFL